MLLDIPICDFGWKAPDFTLQDPDGTSYTLSEYLGDKGVLIAFIGNHCLYVQAIADRLTDDACALQAEGIGVLAVMSNDDTQVPLGSPPNMKRFAAEHGFSFPYLVDGTQQVGRAYGAVCAPDFFGLNKDGELQYRDRLDDADRGDPANRTRELVDAMRQIAATGQGPLAQKPSMGCSIKWT